jgi:hypothetical protein
MNLIFPADDAAVQSSRRAMEGVLAIKRDKAQITKVLGELEHMLSYFSQLLEQTRERFKQEVEMDQRMNRKEGARGRMPDKFQEYREEWANVARQLNARFEMNLAEFKERIIKIN